MDVVLASASPRRRELLSLIFEDFRVIPSEFDEDGVPDDLGPAEHVQHSALMKARDVALLVRAGFQIPPEQEGQHPDSLVIGADTIVVIDNRILGKPRAESDAAEMLKALGGRTHQVYSGIAVIQACVERTAVECTDVTFRPLSDEIIARYISTGEPMDKAGAYAIQGKGSVLIQSINGCYFNVVGLPIYRLSRLLEEFGVGPLHDS